MGVSIRKLEEPVYDGTSGAQIDTHVSYQLGGDIDGTFVPFATVRESYVGHLQRLDKEQQEKASQSGTTEGETTSAADTGALQSPAVPTATETTTGETTEES